MTALFLSRLSWRPLVLALGATLTGCAVYSPPHPAEQPYGWDNPYPDTPVTQVYVDPPMYQPEPIMVEWAPPPLLAEYPPPMPFPGAIWIGGYWLWQDGWIWATGRWSAPPQQHYHWVPPYYEHRSGMVVFIPGFWAAPNVVFMAPPPTARLMVARAPARRGAHPRPMGPPGPFVPPPPGSRHGLIVPAPVGTAPGVVLHAPPVVQPGMRVQRPSIRHDRDDDGPPNVTIFAPPGVTRNGRPFEHVTPMQPPTRPVQGPPQRMPPPGAQPREQFPDRGRMPDMAPTPRGMGQPPAPFGMPQQPRLRDEAPGMPPSEPPMRRWPADRSVQGEPQGQSAPPTLRGPRGWPNEPPAQRGPYEPSRPGPRGDDLRQRSTGPMEQPPVQQPMPPHMRQRMPQAMPPQMQERQMPPQTQVQPPQTQPPRGRAPSAGRGRGDNGDAERPARGERPDRMLRERRDN